MKQRKIILSVLTIAVCMNVAIPSIGMAQTVYTPANQVYVGGANGQTIIVRDTAPTQTIIVRENVPQTVIVQETAPVQTYYPETAYVSNESLVAAGVTGLVGGVLLGTLLDKSHHKHKHAAPAAPHRHNGGNHKHTPPRNGHSGKAPRGK